MPNRFLFILSLLIVVGCDNTGSGNTTPDSSRAEDIALPDTNPPPLLCGELPQPIEDLDCTNIGRVFLEHVESRHDVGLHVYTRLEDPNGQPLGIEYASCIEVLDARTCEPTSTRSTVTEADSLSAVLVHPGSTEAEAKAARDLTHAWLNQRPADERIAVFRWGEVVTQIASPSADRHRLKRLLDAQLVPLANTPLETPFAIESVREDLEGVSDGTLVGLRGLAVINLRPDARMVPDRTPGPLWIHGLLGPGITTSHVESLSQAFDDAIAQGLVLFSWCGDGTERQMMLKVAGTDSEVALTVPKRLPEEFGLSCTPETLTLPRSYPDVIEFVFNPSQRAIYDQFVETSNKTDFELYLRLWEEGDVVEAKANLRGQSSLDCERKSYSVNIKGSRQRHFAPGAASDEFYLIAMCLDDRYLHQYTADQLTQSLGAFPLQFRLVELRVEGDSRGVYLMIEKVKETLLIKSTRARSLLRRDTDIDNKPPELKFASGSEADALERYDALISDAQSLEGQALLDALERHMDIDQYLRWVALMSLLGNGDYVDEVFFFATETTSPTGERADFFTIVGWDPDDLFSACHHNGRFALEDPHNILYCAESLLDHAIFDDPVVYQRFAQVLEAVLAEITPEVFNATIDTTVEALWTYLQHDDIRGAMVELLSANPNAIDATEAERDIRATADTMKTSFLNRHNELNTRLSEYHQKQP